MKLYKALSNFTYENVVVIYEGNIIYNGEAWLFDKSEYHFHLVTNMSIHYVGNKAASVFIYIMEE